MSSIIPPGYGGYTSSMDYGPYGNYGTIRFPSQSGGWSPETWQNVGAGVQAAGSVAGSWLDARSRSRALEMQMGATEDAIKFQREQATRAAAAYRTRWDAWNQARTALLQRFGIDISPPQRSDTNTDPRRLRGQTLGELMSQRPEGSRQESRRG